MLAHAKFGYDEVLYDMFGGGEARPCLGARIEDALEARTHLTCKHEDFCMACFHGDLEKLEVMLDREDVVYGFQGDLNAHVSKRLKSPAAPSPPTLCQAIAGTMQCRASESPVVELRPDYTALHLAAENGQLEVVEMLLQARVDPHIRTRVPLGKDAEEGKTALMIADDWGWDEIVALLKKAEASEPKGDYVMYGEHNNSKIYPSNMPGGRPLEEVKKMKEKLLTMWRPYFLEEGNDPRGVSLLFPGQGSQYLKMLEGVSELPAVKQLILDAKEILGWDPLELCLKGPAPKLEQVEYCDPLMYIAGCAGLEKLKQDMPEAAARLGAVAGLGVGEITALVAAGVLTFQDGLKVAKARGEALREVGATSPQATLAIVGIRSEQLEEMCSKVKAEAGADTVCEVAHLLMPKGAVCAGSKTAMEKLQKLAQDAGVLQCKLNPNCGAINTKLMAPAATTMEAVLKELSSKMKAPKCSIFMSSMSRPVRPGSNPRSVIVPLVLRGMVEPVLWEANMRKMIQSGYEQFVEVGPMQQLTLIMKRIDPFVHGKMKNIEV